MFGAYMLKPTCDWTERPGSRLCWGPGSFIIHFKPPSGLLDSKFQMGNSTNAVSNVIIREHTDPFTYVHFITVMEIILMKELVSSLNFGVFSS